MTRRILIISAVVGAALMLAVPAARGNGQPSRDAGDATSARLALGSPLVVRDTGDAVAARLALRSSPSPLVIRDAGDAVAAKLTFQSPPESSTPEQLRTGSGREIDWAQLVIGFGVGMFFVLGVMLTIRVSRSHGLAH